jgi:hypothetical protein
VRGGDGALTVSHDEDIVAKGEITPLRFAEGRFFVVVSSEGVGVVRQGGQTEVASNLPLLFIKYGDDPVH